jgi:hypothetical protein
MSDATSIGGTTEPGWQAQADFPFYKGQVGVRDRGEWLDVAFFVPASPKPRLPTTGLLDSRPVRITAVSTRPVDPSLRRGSMQAVTVTATLEA